MLILGRKVNESILFLKDDTVIAEITVLNKTGNKFQTRLGIKADDDIVVLREEVVYKKRENGKDLGEDE